MLPRYFRLLVCAVVELLEDHRGRFRYDVASLCRRLSYLTLSIVRGQRPHLDEPAGSVPALKVGTFLSCRCLD